MPRRTIRRYSQHKMVCTLYRSPGCNIPKIFKAVVDVETLISRGQNSRHIYRPAPPEVRQPDPQFNGLTRIDSPISVSPAPPQCIVVNIVLKQGNIHSTNRSVVFHNGFEPDRWTVNEPAEVAVRPGVTITVLGIIVETVVRDRSLVLCCPTMPCCLVDRHGNEEWIVAQVDLPLQAISCRYLEPLFCETPRDHKGKGAPVVTIRIKHVPSDR